MNKIHEQSSSQFKISDAEKILLVEDNQVNIEVAFEMLDTLGFAVDFAYNGQQAIDLYDKNKHILILMDCEMPVMDGFDTARQIRKDERELQHNPTPIIALTAHDETGVREKFLSSGMNDYLSKPFSISALSAMLNKWLVTDSAEPAEHQISYSDDVESNNNKSGIIDYEVLNQLRNMQKKDDSNLVIRVVTLYLEQSSRLLVELKEASQRADVETVRIVSHTLKSSSGNVGATGLSELCRKVEKICESGQIETSLVQQIYRTFSDVEKALNDVLYNIKL